LTAVADFCQEHRLWLHVDGAHGASVAFSSRHRGLLAGIERADSVVWDAHKLMLMPAVVTAVLFRDGRRSYEPFAQQASYLFADVSPEEQWFNLAGRTLECTKSMMVLKVYAGLCLHGPAFFGQYVDGLFALAQSFADLIAAAADFELPLRPQANIVCFRYRSASMTPGPALDRLQSVIRQRLIASGAFYLVQTGLPTGVHLRTTLLNPFTTIDHLRQLLDAVRAAADS
jgi:L-2,4-diaminobutyrate decarboxylase